MSEVWKSKCGLMELRKGDWREVLADVEPDHVITDPPYSARTHGKQRHGRRDGHGDDWASARGIGYAHWTGDDVKALYGAFPAAGWIAALTDSELWPYWIAHSKAAGRTNFAPVSCVLRGMNVRLAGDGPSNWSIHLAVARLKSISKWGTLPGAYVGNPFDPGENTAKASRRQSVVGAKPAWLMRQIVRDYSRKGELVCDPCAGGGTTLLAAAMEGRRAIGAEIDPKTFALAVKRLEAGYTPQFSF